MDTNFFGDERARSRFYEELRNPELVYRRYYKQIYRYVRRRLPSEHDAEDVCAQIFTDALVALPNLRWRKRPLIAFLYTLARRGLINHWRKHRKTEWVPLEESDERAAIMPSVCSLVDYGKLVGAIDQLPGDQRLGIYLQVIRGFSFAELSLILGRREKACKSLVYRGLETLRQKLVEEGIHPDTVDRLTERPVPCG